MRSVHIHCLGVKPYFVNIRFCSARNSSACWILVSPNSKFGSENMFGVMRQTYSVIGFLFWDVSASSINAFLIALLVKSIDCGMHHGIFLSENILIFVDVLSAGSL